jgi:hypothetical protein
MLLKDFLSFDGVGIRPNEVEEKTFQLVQSRKKNKKENYFCPNSAFV